MSRSMVLFILIFAPLLIGLVEAQILKATPDVISTSPTVVTVSWEGIPYPTSGDWIGIYSPPESYSFHWVGYLYVTGSPTWSEGRGNITMKLVNMRMDYEFRYFRQYTEFSVTTSNRVQSVVTYPTQAHLSLTNDPTEMRVMWITGSNKQKPKVIYGTTSGKYNFAAYGTSTTYTKDQMCGLDSAKYFIDPGQIHNVLLTGLAPNTRYYYKYGNDIEGWSEEKDFVTAPLVGNSPPNGIMIAAFGDSGSSYCEGWYGGCEPGSAATYSQIAADSYNKQYNFLIHNGDISYALGVAHRWEQYFSEIEQIAARVPYMVCMGNHEYDWYGSNFNPHWGNYGDDSGGECGVPFNTRFQMPGKSPEQNTYYSFDYGIVHVAMISTEHNYTYGSEQYEWLKRDLSSVDHNQTPWVIFAYHRPMYTSIEHGDTIDLNVAEVIRQNLEPLLVKYNVDLALSAHIHAYERTCPIIQFRCVQNVKAPVHVCIGTGGRDINLNFLKQPNWAVHRENQYGWTRIHIVNRTALHMEYIIGATGKVADDFWIYK